LSSTRAECAWFDFGSFSPGFSPLSIRKESNPMWTSLWIVEPAPLDFYLVSLIRQRVFVRTELFRFFQYLRPLFVVGRGNMFHPPLVKPAENSLRPSYAVFFLHGRLFPPPGVAYWPVPLPCSPHISVFFFSPNKTPFPLPFARPQFLVDGVKPSPHVYFRSHAFLSVLLPPPPFCSCPNSAPQRAQPAELPFRVKVGLIPELRG